MKQLKKIYWKRIGVIGISCFLLLWSCLLTGCGIGKGDSGKPAACTISIDCQTILDNIGDLKETKKEFVPEDGWILPEMEVKFTTGYYVEGINQLYEFDCGKNSGWMYSVNGEFPNYGASSYKPKDGDKIEWKYTCNLGSDVGNPYKDKK